MKAKKGDLALIVRRVTDSYLDGEDKARESYGLVAVESTNREGIVRKIRTTSGTVLDLERFAPNRTTYIIPRKAVTADAVAILAQAPALGEFGAMGAARAWLLQFKAGRS